MEKTTRKRNVYAILFFLAFLFLLVGLEKNSPVSGFFTRSSSAYPETWFSSCMSANAGPQAAGQDLARTLVDKYGCKPPTPTYCHQALVQQLPLPQGITVRVQCPSPPLLQDMVSSCQQQVDLLCQRSKSTSRFGFRR